MINVPRSRVNDLVLGRRAITAATAIRLGRYFGTVGVLAQLQAGTIWTSRTERSGERSNRKSRPEARPEEYGELHVPLPHSYADHYP